MNAETFLDANNTVIEYYISQCVCVFNVIQYQSVSVCMCVCDEVLYQSVSRSVGQSVYGCM
jgi:hypothetical protein